MKKNKKGITSVDIVMILTIAGLISFSLFLTKTENKPFENFIENGIFNVLKNNDSLININTKSLNHYKDFGTIKDNTLYFDNKTISLKSSPISPNGLPDSSLKLEAFGDKKFICNLAINENRKINKYMTYINGKDYKINNLSYQECINIPTKINTFQLTQYFY